MLDESAMATLVEAAEEIHSRVSSSTSTQVLKKSSAKVEAGAAGPSAAGAAAGPSTAKASSSAAQVWVQGHTLHPPTYWPVVGGTEE